MHFPTQTQQINADHEVGVQWLRSASKGRFDRALKVPERAARGLPHVASVGADEFLEAVLEGHEPGDRPILVGDQGEVVLLGLHLAHQPVHRFALRDEPHGTHALGDGTITVALAFRTHEVLGDGEAEP